MSQDQHPATSLHELADKLEALRPTDGPWSWDQRGEKVNEWGLGVAMDRSENFIAGRFTSEDVVYVEYVCSHEAATCNYHDPELICLLRNNLPAIISALRSETAFRWRSLEDWRTNISDWRDANQNEIWDAARASVTRTESASRWVLASERNPDKDGRLWAILTESRRDGEPGPWIPSYEYYHFIDGWATDEPVRYWLESNLHPLPKVWEDK